MVSFALGLAHAASAQTGTVNRSASSTVSFSGHVAQRIGSLTSTASPG